MEVGWRASDTRELSFRAAAPEGVRASRRRVQQFLEILDGGRSVASMGAAWPGAYDLAYVLARATAVRQADRVVPGGAQLADLATDIEAGVGSSTAAWLKDEDGPSHSPRRRRSSTPACVEPGRNIALQIHGGYGFMDEFAISRRDGDPRSARARTRCSAW
jgi:alkylation response protein AidB-like acyl-CoA dehydrogenase